MDNQTHLTKRERRELRHQEKIENRQKMQKSKAAKKLVMWVSIIAGLGAIVYGLFLIGGNSSNSAGSVLSDRVALSDHVKGNLDSEIIVVVYSDFQCPACALYQTMTKQLVEEYGNSIQFVYRNLPLKQIHSNAELAARAAEAASQQDKFWEMHDLLFENQSDWSNNEQPQLIFVEYADHLELDAAKFLQDLDSDIIKNKVEADYQSGMRSKVNATPTFFLNGDKIQNPQNYESFRELIEQTIT